MRSAAPPKVFVVGGGFAGIAAARVLAGAPVDVRLIDRHNHRVFQPLLFQVATASRSLAEISSPILLSWFSGWLLNVCDARLITGDSRLDTHVPRPPDFVPDDAPAA